MFFGLVISVGRRIYLSSHKEPNFALQYPTEPKRTV